MKISLSHLFFCYPSQKFKLILNSIFTIFFFFKEAIVIFLLYIVFGEIYLPTFLPTYLPTCCDLLAFCARQLMIVKYLLVLGTAWKLYSFGVILVRIFPHCIQSECGLFSRSVLKMIYLILIYRVYF